MKRWWCSWVCEEDDYRPVTYPPNPSILGWWCTGYEGDGATLCARVIAKDERRCREVIEKDWPDWDGTWRIEPTRKEGPPGDRFPPSEWMKDRFILAGMEEWQ